MLVCAYMISDRHENESGNERPARAALDDRVRRAVGGDKVALKVLLTDSYDDLCRYIERKAPSNLRRIVDAEDVVQDAHVEVFRRIETFQPRGADAFQRWVTTIAISRLRNSVKRHRAAKRNPGLVAPMTLRVEESSVALFDALAGPGRTPSASLARCEAIDAVHGAIADLPEQYQQVVWLVHIDGCTVKDVATRIDRTERAVHGLCRRGMDLLRERLGSASRFMSTTGPP